MNAEAHFKLHIEKILPPMRRFGGGNRTERKQNIIDKVKKFFEKYFGVFNSKEQEDEFEYSVKEEEDEYLMVAEDGEKYEDK